MMHPEIPEILAPIKEQLLKTLVSCNEITLREGSTKPWDSKVGGCPYLRSVEEYPMSENGSPMLFFAQINLAELDGEDALPKKGLLQFFVENNGDLYGEIDGAHIRYLAEFSENEAELVQKHPYEDDEEYYDLLPYSKEGRMIFTRRQMFLSSSLDTEFEELREQLQEEDQKAALWDLCYASGCKVGGYPYFVQNDSGFDISEEYLLLQLDCEDECNIMFGDAGDGNFWISREALSKLDFSQTIYDWQCC